VAAPPKADLVAENPKSARPATANGAFGDEAALLAASVGARVEAIMAAPGDRPFELARAVTAMRAALGISRDE
jgi:hypothetical protein